MQPDSCNKAYLEYCKKDSSSSFFFDGAIPKWSDLLNEYDIPREITPLILSRVKGWAQGKLVIPILAEGGEGKSTLLNRIAINLANENYPILYHRRDCIRADAQDVERFVKEYQSKIVIFIDDAARVQNLEGFLHSIAEISFPIVIIIASRIYEWQTIRSVYRANVLFDKEYLLTGLSDQELIWLLQHLSKQGFIRQLSEDELPLAVNYYSTRTKRKLLILVLELTHGERIHEVIRSEIDRVKALGTEIFRAYRYCALMGSVHSYITISLLQRLVSIDDLELDVVSKLIGLVEKDGDKLHMRHDRIGEIATQILFEGQDIQRANLINQVISLAIEQGEANLVEWVIGSLRTNVPDAETFRIAEHIFDTAYTAGYFDLARNVVGELMWDNSTDMFEKLLSRKTPVIIENIILSDFKLHINWQKIQEIYAVQFPDTLQSQVIKTSRYDPIERAFKWLELYAIAAQYSSKNEFFTTIASLAFETLSIIFPDKAIEIDFRYAEFLRGNWKNDSAIKMYHRVLLREPKHAKALTGLSLSLYLTDKYKDALKYYKLAREINFGAILEIDEYNIAEEMLERFGELDELIVYKKELTKKANERMRRMKESQLTQFMRVSDIALPQSEADRQSQEYMKWLEPNSKKYSKEEEEKALLLFDQLQELCTGVSEDKKTHFLKQIFRHFGELREELKEGN